MKSIEDRQRTLAGRRMPASGDPGTFGTAHSALGQLLVRATTRPLVVVRSQATVVDVRDCPAHGLPHAVAQCARADVVGRARRLMAYRVRGGGEPVVERLHALRVI